MRVERILTMTVDSLTQLIQWIREVKITAMTWWFTDSTDLLNKRGANVGWKFPRFYWYPQPWMNQWLKDSLTQLILCMRKEQTLPITVRFIYSTDSLKKRGPNIGYESKFTDSTDSLNVTQGTLSDAWKNHWINWFAGDWAMNLGYHWTIHWFIKYDRSNS